MPTTKQELSAEQKDEIKSLILLKVSDGEIIKRFGITRGQLGSLKGAAVKQKDRLSKNLPANAQDSPIPTVNIDVPVSKLLEAGDEARIVIRLIK